MKFRHVSMFLFGVIALVAAGSCFAADDNALKFKLKPGASGKRCLDCHIPFKEKLAKASVHTPLKKGECTGCHDPHASSHGKLLAAGPQNVCATCHSSMVPATALSVHKVVGEGSCMKCHDPHSSPNKGNLLKEGNALCGECHKSLVEGVAKVKFKHPPVGKGCLVCHDPHASAKSETLLKSPMPALCTGCHKTDKPAFVKAHMNYPVATARCTGCHDPHGSDVAGLLYTNVHRPVLSKMCNQCHEEAGSPTPLKTRKAGYELCRGCHSDMVNKMLTKNRAHWPALGKDGCLSCHNPHASKKNRLLKGEMLTLCGSCHKDTIKRQEKSLTKHEPIESGRCTACHDPHASDSVYLAKQASMIDLCGTCHDWQKHSSHPLGDKVRDPRNKNLSVQCLSCHRAHGTEYKHFIPVPTTNDLCVQCHEKFKR